MEIFEIYFENDMKHVNTFSEPTEELYLMLKWAVHIVTTVI